MDEVERNRRLLKGKLLLIGMVLLVPYVLYQLFK
jgi:hypothetical protein